MCISIIVRRARRARASARLLAQIVVGWGLFLGLVGCTMPDSCPVPGQATGCGPQQICRTALTGNVCELGMFCAESGVRGDCGSGWVCGDHNVCVEGDPAPGVDPNEPVVSDPDEPVLDWQGRRMIYVAGDQRECVFSNEAEGFTDGTCSSDEAMPPATMTTCANAGRIDFDLRDDAADAAWEPEYGDPIKVSMSISPLGSGLGMLLWGPDFTHIGQLGAAAGPHILLATMGEHLYVVGQTTEESFEYDLGRIGFVPDSGTFPIQLMLNETGLHVLMLDARVGFGSGNDPIDLSVRAFAGINPLLSLCGGDVNMPAGETLQPMFGAGLGQVQAWVSQRPRPAPVVPSVTIIQNDMNERAGWTQDAQGWELSSGGAAIDLHVQMADGRQPGDGARFIGLPCEEMSAFDAHLIDRNGEVLLTPKSDSYEFDLDFYVGDLPSAGHSAAIARFGRYRAGETLVWLAVDAAGQLYLQNIVGNVSSDQIDLRDLVIGPGKPYRLEASCYPSPGSALMCSFGLFMRRELMAIDLAAYLPWGAADTVAPQLSFCGLDEAQLNRDWEKPKIDIRSIRLSQ